MLPALLPTGSPSVPVILFACSPFGVQVSTPEPGVRGRAAILEAPEVDGHLLRDFLEPLHDLQLSGDQTVPVRAALRIRNRRLLQELRGDGDRLRRGGQRAPG